MARVLITYSWNRVGYGILRSLKQKGHYVISADTSKVNICSWSKFVDKSYVYASPFREEQKFIKDLLKIIDKEDIELLMPTHDEGLVVSKYRHLFPNNLIIGIEEYDKIIAMSNKTLSSKVAESLNIPIAKKYKLEDFDKLHFPFVVRSDIGNSQTGFFIISNENQKHAVLKKIDISQSIIQQYFPGNDYCADIVNMNGFFEVIIFKSMGVRSPKGGTITRRLVVKNEKIRNYCKQIVDYYNFQGVCGIDFMVNEETQNIIFIEINARYTGALSGSCLSGFDIPSIHVNLLSQKITNKPEIVAGTQTRWILGELIGIGLRIFNLSIKYRDIKDFFKFSFKKIDDLRKDDIKAFFGQIFYYVFNIIAPNR